MWVDSNQNKGRTKADHLWNFPSRQNWSSYTKKAPFSLFCKINPVQVSGSHYLWRDSPWRIPYHLRNFQYCQFSVNQALTGNQSLVVLFFWGHKTEVFYFLSSSSVLDWDPFTPANYKYIFYFVCRKLRFLIQFLETIRFFFLSETPLLGIWTPPSQQWHPHSSLSPQSLVSLPLENIWEQPGPGWSKSQLLNMHPVCKACQILLLRYPTDLRGGFLDLGHILESTREIDGGWFKLNWNALALLWPVEGIWGKSFLGFEKRNRKTNGLHQLGWGAILTWLGCQLVPWIAVNDIG